MDRIGSKDNLASLMAAGGYTKNDMLVLGQYHAVFRTAKGDIYHEETFDNLVTLVGKQLLLDSVLGPSAYTLVGPFMGLIGSATSSTTPVVGDTLTSHAAWVEASTTNVPTYNGTRLTLTFSASSPSSPSVTKQTSSTNTFTFTGSGNATGALIITGTGATNVAGATTGVLFSAGLLTTAQPVISGNTLTLTYSTTLN